MEKIIRVIIQRGDSTKRLMNSENNRTTCCVMLLDRLKSGLLHLPISSYLIERNVLLKSLKKDVPKCHMKLHRFKSTLNSRTALHVKLMNLSHNATKLYLTYQYITNSNY